MYVLCCNFVSVRSFVTVFKPRPCGQSGSELKLRAYDGSHTEQSIHSPSPSLTFRPPSFRQFCLTACVLVGALRLNGTAGHGPGKRASDYPFSAVPWPKEAGFRLSMSMRHTSTVTILEIICLSLSFVRVCVSNSPWLSRPPLLVKAGMSKKRAGSSFFPH